MTQSAFSSRSKTSSHSWTRRFRSLLAGLALATGATTTQAADLTWRATGLFWDTTTPNWNGGTAVWNNSVPDNAIFSNPIGSLVLIDEDIIAGTMTFSTTGYAITSAGSSPDATLTFSQITVNEPGNIYAWAALGGMEYNLVGSNGVTGRVFLFKDSMGLNATLNLAAANAISDGLITVSGESAINANIATSISGGEIAFTENSFLNLNAAGTLSGGTQNFEDQSSLNAGVTNGISGGSQNFADNSVLNASVANAVSGGSQSFAGSSTLEATAADAVSGGTQIFNDSSSLNATVENAVSGGNRAFYGTSTLNASAMNSVSGGTGTFWQNSSLNATAASSVSGGVNSFLATSTLAATASGAISGGVQNFEETGSLTASAINAVAGGSQVFRDNSTLQASATGAIGGGIQTFLDSSSLAISAANAISGGSQSFAGNSQLIVNVANGVSGRTVTLTEEAGIAIGADEALSSSVALLFDNTTGGTGGLLSLGGFDSSAGPLSSLTAAAGIIQNGGVAASTLTVNFNAVSTEYSGLIRDNSGAGGALAINKTGSGEWLLSGANTYTGGTTVSSGVLTTNNISALGTGPVAISGGTLLTQSNLAISELTWNSGHIQMDLAALPTISITNDLINGGGVQTFILDYGAPLAVGNTFTLLTFGGLTNFTAENFSAILQNLGAGITPLTSFLVTGNTVEMSIIGFVASGPLLQNSAPVGIPTTADFIVSGVASTGSPTENNVIRSLTFANGSSLQVSQTLTVTSGTLDVPAGLASINGGTVATPGDLTKIGSGTLNTTSAIIAGGSANLAAGSWLVNGTLTAANGLNILPGTLLGGAGSITANVTNSGLLSPGNSPGTLTINGNYTQTPQGAFLLEAASSSVFDQLVVNGNAALAGTLFVQAASLEYGQRYEFLQAQSISGTFDTISMPDPAIFRGRFLAEDGTGTLLIAPTSYTLVAATQNQTNVAAALDAYIPATNGDRLAVSVALDSLTAGEYPAAFDAIAPTFYESLANITIEQTSAQNQLIAQRLSAVRLGSRGFSAIGMEAPLRNDKDGKNVMDAKEGKDMLRTSVDNKWGVWVQGNGIFAKVVNVSQVPNYRFNSGGFLFGADYKLSENLTTGVYAGYQGTYAKYADDSNLRLNSALFGGYATYDNGGFYADAIVGGGYSNYTVKRAISFGTIDRVARSQPGGGQFTTYLDAGYDWEVKGFTFGPIISGQYTYAGVAPFTESGADSLDLRVNQQNANSIRTNIGGRIAYTWNLARNVTLIPELRLFWQHEFLNNPRNIGAALDGGSGPSFGYGTSAPARDSVFAGTGLSAQIGERWNGYVYYNADFGRQDYLSHAISAGLNFEF